MSEIYKLEYKRHVLRGVSDLMTVTAMKAMTMTAYQRMASSSWLAVDEQTSDLPPHKYDQTGHLDTYDAAKYCGDYANGKQKAYACAACYSIRLPADARAGTAAKVEAIIASFYGDRWLAEGAVVSAFLSANESPPDWATIVDNTNSLASTPDPAPAIDEATAPDWQSPLRASVRSNAGPDHRYDAVITANVPFNATAYLHIVIRLSDYISVPKITLPDATQKDSSWIEGGAAIDGATLQVQFDRVVLPDVEEMPERNLVDTDHDGWSDLSEFYAGTDLNDSRSTPITVLDLICDYPGHISGGQIVIHAYSTPSMDGVPDAVFHIPLNDWVVKGATRFMSKLTTSDPVKGRLKEGSVWFFAFLDEDMSGEYDVTKPACVSTYGETSIGWGNNTAYFVFSDEAFGYARVQWEETPRIGMVVTVSYAYAEDPLAPENLTTVEVFKKRIRERNYLHEGDFLYQPENSPYSETRKGLPVYDYTSEFTVTIGEGESATEQTVQVYWYEAITPRIVPYVDPQINTATVRERDVFCRWVGDTRSSGFVLRVERNSGSDWQEVLIRYVHNAAPYATSGTVGRYELIINHADGKSRIDFEDGEYRVSVANLINEGDLSTDPIPVTAGAGNGGSSAFGGLTVLGGGYGGKVLCYAPGGFAIAGGIQGDYGANGGGGGGGVMWAEIDDGPTRTYFSMNGKGLLQNPIYSGNDGGWPDVGGYVTIPSSGKFCTTWWLGGGGGGAGGKGGSGETSDANRLEGGKGVKVDFCSTLNTFFGCGGGAGSGSNGGLGRTASDPTATTGRGTSGANIASGYTSGGLDHHGDGGGGGTIANHGAGGAGAVYVLEYLNDETTNLVEFKTTSPLTSKESFYTPSETAYKIDVLVVGGGGEGGYIHQDAAALTNAGVTFYGGGGGGGGGVLLLLGISVKNLFIPTGWTTPHEFSIDLTDGVTDDGPFSISGAVSGSVEGSMKVYAYRKPSLTIDSDGLVREGFGGLPAACTNINENGAYTIAGLPSGNYMVIVKADDTYQSGGWYSYPDGRPKPIELTSSLSGIDIEL